MYVYISIYIYVVNRAVTLEQMKLQNWSLAYQAPEEAQVEGEPGEAIWLLNPEWFSAVFTSWKLVSIVCLQDVYIPLEPTEEELQTAEGTGFAVLNWSCKLEKIGFLIEENHGKPIVGCVVAFVVWKRKTCWNYPAKCCTRWGSCYGCCRYRGAASSHAPNTSTATLL